ncbi:MAG: hypothetical protein JNL74_11135 [Fibrobacteres bacterium]|nr:hypothetical protein [Fibrobacterota bacterium]
MFKIIILVTALLTHGAVNLGQVHRLLQTDSLFEAKYTYVKEAEKAIYLVDISNLSEVQIASLTGTGSVYSPLISPNGKWLTFWFGSQSGGTVYVCELKANAQLHTVGSGFDPHWWVNPSTGKVNLVYPTGFEGMNFPQVNGSTILREIDTVTLEAASKADTLIPYSFNAGLSPYGQFMATAYMSTDLYDIHNKFHYSLNGGLQACNASITPSKASSEQDLTLMLGLGITIDDISYAVHEVFYIRNRTDEIVWYQEMVPGIDEWQKPEWSTHRNYAAALGRRTGTSIYDAYLIKIDSGFTPLSKTSDYSPVKIKEGLTFGSFPHFYLADDPVPIASRGSLAMRDSVVIGKLISSPPPKREEKNGFCGQGALMATLFLIVIGKREKRKLEKKNEKQ